jgi:hypothetical protein
MVDQCFLDIYIVLHASQVSAAPSTRASEWCNRSTWNKIWRYKNVIWDPKKTPKNPKSAIPNIRAKVVGIKTTWVSRNVTCSLPHSSGSTELRWGHKILYNNASNFTSATKAPLALTFKGM